MISVKYELNGKYDPVVNTDQFFSHMGVFSPLIVDTAVERDYLWGMALMTSNEVVILVNGVDENPTGVPPTFVKIDIPLQ